MIPASSERPREGTMERGRPKGLRLPRRCECGGKMLYEFSLGRIFSCCDTCSPVVQMKLPRKARK
jgi:hypothetical protein